MYPDDTTKRCPRCEERKPFDAFRKDRQRRDGHYPYCKACERDYQRAKAGTKTVTERYCPACERVLLAAAFSRNKNTTDGMMRYCKECDSRLAAAFRATHGEYLKQYKAAYGVENTEKIRATKRRGYLANRSRTLARNRAWLLANRDKVREYARRTRQRYPDRVRENRMRYNARKVAATTERVDYNAVWRRDGGICHICNGLVATDDIHFDHVIPLSKGGSHTYDNIKVAHSKCNIRKGTKLL